MQVSRSDADGGCGGGRRPGSSSGHSRLACRLGLQRRRTKLDRAGARSRGRGGTNVQDDAKNGRSIQLSRQEFRFFMALRQVSRMIGLEAPADDPTVANPQARARTIREGRESLVARGMIRPGGSGEKDKVQGKLLRHALPCFFPEKALLMIRDLPQVGRQILILFRRGASTVVPPVPDPASHRLEEMEGAEDVAALVLSVFPLPPPEVP